MRGYHLVQLVISSMLADEMAVKWENNGIPIILASGYGECWKVATHYPVPQGINGRYMWLYTFQSRCLTLPYLTACVWHINLKTESNRQWLRDASVGKRFDHYNYMFTLDVYLYKVIWMRDARALAFAQMIKWLQLPLPSLATSVHIYIYM